MYKIEEFNKGELSFIELKNNTETNSAVVFLNEGGRLQELKINDIFLIKEQPNFDYKVSYASSILFPFASRIQKGTYTFQEKEYQFNCNESGVNALHGLVYDKKFKLIEKEEGISSCSVTIAYKEIKESKGFPYTYEIYLTYLLSKEGIDVSIEIKNTDSKPYPFTLGWHPYFISDNLSKSTLRFKSDKKIIFDKDLITKEIIDHKSEDVFEIKEQQLDDCFILNTNKIEFTTPTYQLEIITNLEDNYLQMYTPKGFSVIAIEPMTGVSNSFNNNIGLQILQPKENYTFICNVKLKNF